MSGAGWSDLLEGEEPDPFCGVEEAYWDLSGRGGDDGVR